MGLGPVMLDLVGTRITDQERQLLLHPLTGGLDAEGWDFGKAPCLSDFFALLESVAEVDHVSKLEITVRAGEKSTLSELTISPDKPGEIDMPPYTLIYSGKHDIKVTFEKEV